MHRPRGALFPRALFTRAFVVLSVLTLASSLASASDHPPAHPRVHPVQLSNLDYLVLASIAASPHVLTMASYRPAAGAGRVLARSGKPIPRLADD
jgi:hypothetical protein